jgi:OOP family OmpA-OmpF porin
VTLIAAQGTGQDEFDRVIGELGRRTARGLHAQRRPSGSTDARPDPPVSSPRSTRNGVRLRGRLPDGAVGASVEAFAVSLFGRDRTDLATRSVPDLPQGWSVRAMAGLRALSALHDGQMTLEPEALRIRGAQGTSRSAPN